MFEKNLEKDPTVDCSIVVPVYYNEGSLIELYETLMSEAFLKHKDLKFEIVFVDDGSGDGSFEILKSLYEKDPERVRVIRLTRNFGQVFSSLAGMACTKGKCAISISADLQDPPELISKMLDIHIKENIPIVIAARIDREEGWYRRLTSFLFYKTMRALCYRDMPIGGFDYILMSRKVVQFVVSMKESAPFVQGQVLFSGYNKKIIYYKRKKREHGKSRWTFSKKLRYFIDSIISCSYFPIRFVSLLGILVASGGFLYALVIFITRILGNYPFAGWAPMMIIILVVGGLQLFAIGVIGEYIWRTLDQVRNRPRYIIESVLEKQ